MGREVLYKTGTPLVWANSGDYNGDGGDRTHQISLASLADGAAREGDKADLGEIHALEYAVSICLEMGSAPTSGMVFDIYWAASSHATAGTLNPGGCSGADAAYTGTSGDSLDDSLKQLDFIGSVVLTSDAAPALQVMTFIFRPSLRYGMPVVDNNSGQALHNDSVEMFMRMEPIIAEIQ